MTTIAQPSVQSLFIQMRFNGTVLSTGTGFIVTPPSGPLLRTNRHNVTGRHQDTGEPLSKTAGTPNELVIVQNQKGKLGSWLPKLEALYTDEEPRWVEHPSLGAKADLVALPLTDTDDVGFYPYDMDNPGTPIHVGPSDAISVVGFPFGIMSGGAMAIWATGFMATEPDIDFNDLPVFLVDCRSRQGQSGSAVISYRSGGSVAMQDGGTSMFGGPVWLFLGIYSGRINAESDLGVVWKASAIKELVDHAGT